MIKYDIVKICNKPELKDAAADWFHDKWKIPAEEYLESMNTCLTKQNAIPQWYVVLDMAKYDFWC